MIGLLIDCAKGIIKERNKEGIEMKSKMIRNLFLILGGISVLLLGSCSWNSIPKKSSDEFSQYEYAVSFYSYRPKGKRDILTKIFFIDKKGEQKEYSLKGYNVGTLFQKGNELYAYSFGTRPHLVFKSPSTYFVYPSQIFSMGSTTYSVRFVSEGQKGPIEGLSVEDGKVGVLRSRIRYTNSKNKQVVSPEVDLSLDKGIEVNSKIFVTGFDLVGDDMSFLYLDEEKNEFEFIELQDSSQSDFQELLLVDGKVITVGNPKFTRFDDEKKREEKKNKISLTSVDPETLEVSEETFEAERVLTAYPIHNHFRFVTSDHRLLEYTSDLKLVSEKDLSRTDFIKLFSDKGLKVQKVCYTDDKVVVLATPAKASTKERGTIVEFDAATLEVKKRIMIPLSEKTEWETDSADLLLIDHP